MRPICIIMIFLGLSWAACDTTTTSDQTKTPTLSTADSLRLRTLADSLVAVADTAKTGQDSLLFRAADGYKTLRDPAAWVQTQRALFNHFRKDNQYETIVERLSQAIREIWWEADAEAGKLYTLRGFTLRRMGRNYAASVDYEKARALSDRFGGVTRNNPAGPIYKTLANIKTRLGENEEAIKLLQAGLDLLHRDTAQAAWLDNQITRAEIYDDLGIAFQNNNQLPQALEQYDAGLAVLAQLKNLPQKALAEVANTKGLLLSNKASVLFSLGKVGEAETMMRAALDALPPNKSNYRFSALNILAEIKAAQGNDQAAQQSRQTALELSNDSSIEHREVAKLLNEMGWSEYRQRNFDAAMQFAQKALHLLYPDISADDYHQNPDLSLIDPDPENTTAEALDLKGEALWQLSQGTGQLLQLADSTTALAVQMMENLRDVAVYESSKLQAAQKSRLLFSRMMRLLYAQKVAGNTTAAERAFVFAEKSKAVLLQQKIAADAALLAAGVADTLILQERDLKEQRAFLRNELFELEIATDNSKTALVQDLKRRLFQVEQTLRDLQTQIGTRYQLAPQEHHNYVATVADVQKKLLRKNETWIEYFTDPDSNWVYLIAVDEQGLRFNRQPYQESNIRDFIRLFNDEIQAENRSGDPVLFAAFTQTAHQLYRNLIAPAFSEKIPERLTLAPDGALALLPFDVLLRALPQDTSTVNYARLPFLVGSSQLRLAPSASLDLFYAQQPQAKHRGSYAGFAPDYSNSVLGQVVSGADLVRTTAEAFHGEAFVGAGASLDSFLLQAAGHAIIHFHGHAEASDSFPDYSWMAFTAGQPVVSRLLLPKSEPRTGVLSAGPGRLPAAELAHCLFAHQVYQSRLNADLVLLSACQTGLGKIAPGEGTLSLARAFQAAGCPTTVMSLWKVRDDATAQLMDLFLENIRLGQDKDEALTNAKRAYLQTVGDAFPYYWAGFVLTGKTDPVQLAGAWWEGVMAWLLGGFCVLLLMYRYKLFRKNQEKATA